MSGPADEHVGKTEDEDGMPLQGHALVRMAQRGDGPPVPQLWFRCPRDRLYCGVPLKPSPPNARGCSWDWDGNAAAPTVSPSINCNGEGGCGWHGFVTGGVTREA